jgi:hypothetical protein
LLHIIDSGHKVLPVPSISGFKSQQDKAELVRLIFFHVWEITVKYMRDDVSIALTVHIGVFSVMTLCNLVAAYKRF